MGAIVNYLWIGGAIIVVAVLLQVLWMSLDTARRVAHQHAQRKREAQLLQLRVAALRPATGEQQESFAWSGWRKFVVTRKVTEDSNYQVCSFYLEAHDGKPISSFKPGQFLTFQLKIPGQSQPVVRCYSLSDAPKSDHYRVTIKRVRAPHGNPNAPPGLVSNFFHDQVKVGDILDVKSPSGSFVLNLPDNAPVVLIAGGVGITPVLSMLNAITESNSKRETWFFYGVRNKAEHIMREHLENIRREHPNVHLHVCYSDPTDDAEQGVAVHHGEQISVDLVKRIPLPSNNYNFFICGPPPMMDALVIDLGAWGVPQDKDPLTNRIHIEKFGPPSAKKIVTVVDPAATGPLVTFRKSGKAFNWDPSTNRLWDFAKASGITIDSGCLQGNCGSCQVAIISGEVEYPTGDPVFEYEKGTCVTCSCVPKGPLVLDA